MESFFTITLKLYAYFHYKANMGKRFLELLAKIYRSVCFFYNFIEISTNYNYIITFFYNNFKEKKQVSICEPLKYTRRS